jgi:hypothetical protein
LNAPLVRRDRVHCWTLLRTYAGSFLVTVFFFFIQVCILRFALCTAQIERRVTVCMQRVLPTGAQSTSTEYVKLFSHWASGKPASVHLIPNVHGVQVSGNPIFLLPSHSSSAIHLCTGSKEAEILSFCLHLIPNVHGVQVSGNTI